MIFRLAVCAEAIEFLCSERNLWRSRCPACAKTMEFLRRAVNYDFVEFLPFAVRIASVKFPQLAACFVVRIAAMEFLSFAAHIVAVEFRRLATRAIATEFLRSAIYAVLALSHGALSD